MIGTNIAAKTIGRTKFMFKDESLGLKEREERLKIKDRTDEKVLVSLAFYTGQVPIFATGHVAV